MKNSQSSLNWNYFKLVRCDAILGRRAIITCKNVSHYLGFVEQLGCYLGKVTTTERSYYICMRASFKYLVNTYNHFYNLGE